MNTREEQILTGYEEEAEQKWGSTPAYEEQQQKTAGYTTEDWKAAGDAMNEIFARLAACRCSGEGADSTKAQELVAQLQGHITKSYYTCTKEILASLGQMYVADERFRENIDRHGAGTAEYISAAIEHYCR